MDAIRHSRLAGAARRAACRVSLAAVWVAALTACDRTEAGAARHDECARFCDALEKCDDATDLLDCREQCEADAVRSDRYFRARADCGEKLSCTRWMQEVSNKGDDVCTTGECNLSECIRRALDAVELSDAEQDACMALTTKLKACNPALDASEVSMQCEDTTPALSEGYRAESERCGAQDCAQIDACFEKLADRYQTTLKLFSGKVR